jgi:hypothetical protein
VAATPTSQSPAPPATGDNDVDNGGNGAMGMLLVAGIVVLAGGAGAFLLLKRRQA